LAGSIQDLQDWYSLYLETMRRVAVPPRSLRFFEDLWATCSEERFRLFVAEQNASENRTIVAGSVLLIFGQYAFYAFTGCRDAALSLHPHDLLQLTAIRYAYKNGVRWYDLGEVTEEHPSLARFKEKWGKPSQRLYRYYFPTPRSASGESPHYVTAARSLWRGLPKQVTARLGDALYRYL
jgi:hypothetical protein